MLKNCGFPDQKNTKNILLKIREVNRNLNIGKKFNIDKYIQCLFLECIKKVIKNFNLFSPYVIHQSVLYIQLSDTKLEKDLEKSFINLCRKDEENIKKIQSDIIYMSDYEILSATFDEKQNMYILEKEEVEEENLYNFYIIINDEKTLIKTINFDEYDITRDSTRIFLQKNKLIFNIQNTIYIYDTEDNNLNDIEDIDIDLTIKNIHCTEENIYIIYLDDNEKTFCSKYSIEGDILQKEWNIFPDEDIIYLSFYNNIPVFCSDAFIIFGQKRILIEKETENNNSYYLDKNILYIFQSEDTENYFSSVNLKTGEYKKLIFISDNDTSVENIFVNDNFLFFVNNMNIERRKIL